MSAYSYPHAQILEELISSTMSAMASCYSYLNENLEERSVIAFADAVEKIDHSQLNAFYIWLPQTVKKGEMRHLSSTDGRNGNYPLIQKSGKVSDKPTRISKIIKRIIKDTFSDNFQPNSKNIWVPSPLYIVDEILSSPSSPAFSAYVLYSIRTLLFFRYESVPSGLIGKTTYKQFTESDIQKHYSSILTSTTPRFDSQGKDTLSSLSGGGGVLLQFLAYKNVLVFSFRDYNKVIRFLESGDIKPSNGSRPFQKNGSISRMPEVDQIINELWGIPIPIRGADIIFRGGIKLSSKRGLVIAIHGGPGTGKTSLCLTLCAATAPFGIQSVYLSAEEQPTDLQKRSAGLFSDEMQRLPFFAGNNEILFEEIDVLLRDGEIGAIERIEKKIDAFAEYLRGLEEKEDKAPEVPKACRVFLVLDGLHDLFLAKQEDKSEQLRKLHSLVDKLQKLQAVVILTIADEWEAGSSLDYMVDMAMRLSFTEIEAYDAKPDRRITLFKARHQQCAFGTHGLQISGDKGVRFSPQINHQLDQRAIWKLRLPNSEYLNPVFMEVHCVPKEEAVGKYQEKYKCKYVRLDPGVEIPRGSNIFINGNGSGGKAGLAMRIAFMPYAMTKSNKRVRSEEKVLIISFLYPRDYYSTVLRIINRTYKAEFDIQGISQSRLEVMHLYPGYLKPNDLFNRIEWELRGAERVGEPYTTVVIDGLHNVFLQFPEIENYPIFWPQLYSALRSRSLNIITTHTTLTMQHKGDKPSKSSIVDDNRSEPLRHALVQKTDFQITVEPEKKGSNFFKIQFLSAIGKNMNINGLLWERESLTLFKRAER